MLVVTHRTQSEWESIVEAFKESGQTQAVFCREHGINVKTLGNHLHKRARKKQTVKRSEDEWLALIKEQRDSGMNRAAWCRKHGINPDSMTSAEKRSNARLLKKAEPKWLELNPGDNTEPAPSQNGGAGWGVKIRNGSLEIEVNTDYPVEKLSALIERLVWQ
jgi:transposase-like protein